MATGRLRDLKDNNMVNIIGHRYINLFLSGALFVVAVIAILTFGFKTGNDFQGGSLLEVSFTKEVPATKEIQTVLEPLNFGNISVQTVGEDGLILKLRFVNETEHQQMLTALRNKYENNDNKVMEDRFETIGAAVSKQLRTRTVYAVTIVILAIIAYIAYAFRGVSRPVASWKYGVVAVFALFHDVTITAGVFAVLGRYLGVEIDIPFVVALLTILGYSVNDTIVVFDRIRENLIRRSSDDFAGTVNVAINETFARSINTTATTLFTLAALFLFGGETIKYFVLALLIGIFLGAYSSIFVASPLLVEWYNWQNRRKA